MALGKLAVVIGAGLVGSVLSKEGSLSDITYIFSGALKIVTKHLQQDKDDSQSTGKPQTDSLLAQVNSLRQELQILASSRSVTIVTGTNSGSGSYGVTAVIVVGVVGYGYIWWKGWKLSDMMFVTQRGLSDACTADARRHLSSRIDRVDINLDECREITDATRGEVSRLNGELGGIHLEVGSVHHFVQTLGTKIRRIEQSQDVTTQGIYSLCMFIDSLENKKDTKPIQVLPSSSRHTIEPPQTTPVTRAVSLPPVTMDSPSASASPSAAVVSPKVLRSSTAVSTFGLKELQGFSNTVKTGIPKSDSIKTGFSEASNGNRSVGEPSTTSTTSSRAGWKLPTFSVLTRTCSTN